jgi:hypothetical protein
VQIQLINMRRATGGGGTIPEGKLAALTEPCRFSPPHNGRWRMPARGTFHLIP